MDKPTLITIPLLKMEKSMALMEEPGISSITFYEGNLSDVEKEIRSRFQRIISNNPWLSGRLRKNKDYKQVVLQFDGNPELKDRLKNLYHYNESSIEISSKMDYETLIKKVDPVLVKKGRKLVNKDEPLILLSLIPDDNQPKEKFALVFSASHIVADGFTYYELMNSLSDDNPIPVFDVKRKFGMEKKMSELVGAKQYKFGLSLSLTLNVLKGMVIGKKTKCYAFYIDQEKIQQAKNKLNEPSSFVSTNDILTSSFSNAVGARLSMMAINFRNRIDNLSNSDAGNYEGVLLYDKKNYSTPLGIRKSLQSGSPMKTTSDEMPGFLETIRSKFAQTTNWSSFSKTLTLNGATQIIHLPVYSLNTIPFDCAIIFKPVPEKTAVMYFLKSINKEKILSQCEVKETVDSNLFY